MYPFIVEKEMELEKIFGFSLNSFLRIKNLNEKEIVQPIFFPNNDCPYVTLDLQQKKKILLKNCVYLKDEKIFFEESKKLLSKFFFPVKFIYLILFYHFLILFYYFYYFIFILFYFSLIFLETKSK